MEQFVTINGTRYLFTDAVKENDAVRKSFDDLAQATFGLSFHDWYQNGYWTDAYVPHVLLHDGEVVSNVSVNRMHLVDRGEEKAYIQLGTVMTAAAYRKRGLAGYLMQTVLHEFAETSDAVYLFANDRALDFYPKFGFRQADEYRCSYQSRVKASPAAEKLDMANPNDVSLLRSMAAYGNPYARLRAVDFDGLLMFYCADSMRDNVYHCRDYDAILIAAVEGDAVTCYDVFCQSDRVPLDAVVATVAGQRPVDVSMGFTPRMAEGYTFHLLRQDDTTLFLLDNKEDLFRDDKLMFPLLSHA